jgi:hypothetical protein
MDKPSPLYVASVPVFTRGLQSLSRVLDKAMQAHAGEAERARLLEARLAHDMLPLSRQVQITADQAKRGSSRVAGVEPPRHADDERTFEDLQRRIAWTISYIGELPRDAIGAAWGRSLSLDLGGPVEMPAEHYLLAFSLPNFFFHLTTAYGILRHNGIALGKSDYLGDFRSVPTYA